MGLEEKFDFPESKQNSERINVKELREKALKVRFRKVKGLNEITGPKVKQRIEYFQKKVDRLQKKYNENKDKQTACIEVQKLLPKGDGDAFTAERRLDVINILEAYKIYGESSNPAVMTMSKVKDMNDIDLIGFLGRQMPIAANAFAMYMGWNVKELNKYQVEIDRLNKGMKPLLLTEDEELDYKVYESELVAEPRGSVSANSEKGRGMMLSIRISQDLMYKLKLKSDFQPTRSITRYVNKFKEHKDYENMVVKLLGVYDKNFSVNKNYIQGFTNDVLALLVVNFQKEKGLKVDGKPGKNTIKAILDV